MGQLGEIYWRLLSACEYALDLRRAEEWMAMIERNVVWQHFVRPTCQTHYGGILIALGQWSQAEAELPRRDRRVSARATEATESSRWSGWRIFACARGRFEEAERLLDGMDWHPVARRATATIALGARRTRARRGPHSPVLRRREPVRSCVCTAPRTPG